MRLGEKKLYSLAYVDNIMLMAEDEGGMRSMLERLKTYLDRRKLETGKRRVMRFRKGEKGWEG